MLYDCHHIYTVDTPTLFMPSCKNSSTQHWSQSVLWKREERESAKDAMDGCRMCPTRRKAARCVHAARAFHQLVSRSRKECMTMYGNRQYIHRSFSSALFSRGQHVFWSPTDFRGFYREVHDMMKFSGNTLDELTAPWVKVGQSKGGVGAARWVLELHHGRNTWVGESRQDRAWRERLRNRNLCGDETGGGASQQGGGGGGSLLVNRRKLDCLSELQLQLRSYFHLRKRGEILPATLVFSHLFLQLTKLKPNLKQCIFCKVCN